MDLIKSLGERIIALRKQNGISREDLANEFGIPYTTLRNYENGLREPGHLFIVKVAERFNVTADYLLGISDKPYLAKTAPTEQNGENDSQKQELIHNYDSLNQDGKDKLIEYSNDLCGNPKYTEKTYKVKIAARSGKFEERTLTDSDIEKIKNLPDVDDL